MFIKYVLILLLNGKKTSNSLKIGHGIVYEYPILLLLDRAKVKDRYSILLELLLNIFALREKDKNLIGLP